MVRGATSVHRLSSAPTRCHHPTIRTCSHLSRKILDGLQDLSGGVRGGIENRILWINLDRARSMPGRRSTRRRRWPTSRSQSSSNRFSTAFPSATHALHIVTGAIFGSDGLDANRQYRAAALWPQLGWHPLPPVSRRSSLLGPYPFINISTKVRQFVGCTADSDRRTCMTHAGSKQCPTPISDG